MSKQWLSEERTRRLEELRAKYPKAEAPKEPEQHTERHTAYLSVILRFEYKAMSQKEADDRVYHWMWEKGADITDVLYDRYSKDGLQGATLCWEPKSEQAHEADGGQEPHS